jgi:glycosyltransferase involved in cell wall biosynthesis
MSPPPRRSAMEPTSRDTAVSTRADSPAGISHRPPTVAFLTGGDRFEDWFDKVGISLATFRDELTGGWLFNYIEAMQTAGIRTVLLFGSARVRVPIRFVHRPTQTPVCLMPTPWASRKIRAAHDRFLPGSKVASSLASYAATPIWHLARELRREGCDAILCQEYEHPRFDVCVALGRSLGLPVFATYQGGRETPSRVGRAFRRLSIRRCDGLIVAAGSEIERIQETYGVESGRIGHIPNPMDVEGWPPIDRTRARAKLGIPQGSRVVVWHGHAQIRRKGLDILLDAWDLVCARYTRRKPLLLLVGTGRNTAELRRRTSGNPSILWIDRYLLDREELWRYLSAADIYCLPSRSEGFAVAPIEAMSCGLPVVATDVSGVQDLLAGGEEGGGVIVPPEDPFALAMALHRLVEDDELARELGRRARRRAEQEFSLDIVGGRLRRFLFPDGQVAGA